jgi:DNA-binding PadR family transcriptional regulator
MQNIEESTDGAWRPGPGTIYPLLKSLVDERLVRPSHGTSKAATVSYSITEAGEGELAEMRRAMVSFGRKEQFIVRLISDLMPADSLVSILLNRSRDGAEFLRCKIVDLPEPAKTEALREVELLAESQLGWARSELTKSGPSKGRRAPRSIR